MKETENTEKFSKFVGKRIREARESNNLSQMEAGKISGVTYQQWQKYECGMNAIPMSRLYKFARFIDADINDFVKEYENDCE